MEVESGQELTGQALAPLSSEQLSPNDTVIIAMRVQKRQLIALGDSGDDPLLRMDRLMRQFFTNKTVIIYELIPTETSGIIAERDDGAAVQIDSWLTPQVERRLSRYHSRRERRQRELIFCGSVCS
jgi:hypothetical protein